MAEAKKTLDAQVEQLQKGYEVQLARHAALAETLNKNIWAGGRMRLESWLAEISVMLSKLDQQIVQLKAQPHPSQSRMNAAWRRYWDILGALAPGDPRAISWRLQVVSVSLYLQLALAVVLVVYTAYVFQSFNMQGNATQAQWQEGREIAAEAERVAGRLETTALEIETSKRTDFSAATSAPDKSSKGSAAGAAKAAATPNESKETSAVDLTRPRDEVEALAAKLAETNLSEADKKLATARIDTALAEFDREEPRLKDAAQSLHNLSGTFLHEHKRPPSLIRLVLLGSLLGMITITIHTNWKYRNHWNTAGFLAWYATKLVGAPVISLAAIGLLMQVSFASDLSSGAGIAGLGLRDAGPMLIFSVAILTGLFSNRVFDWLRKLTQDKTGGSSGQTAAPGQPATPVEGDDSNEQAQNG